LSALRLIQPSQGKWTPGPPGTAESVDEAARAIGLKFPTAYYDFLTQSDGGEGDLPVMPGLVIFWTAQQLIELNRAYDVEHAVPGFYGIGTSGGGEMFAFDARSKPWSVNIVPFIPMQQSGVILIAPDFESFLAIIGKGVWTGDE
jgi:hypothetical protein